MFEASRRPERQYAMWLWTLGFIGLFGYGVFLLYAPDKFPLNFIRGEVVKPTEQLMFGPYPVEEELRRLQRMGVVEVLSLLDNDSPIERELVAREKALVEGLGMRFVNVPVPVSNVVGEADRAVLDRVVRQINDHPVSLRYVHCFLGRHRVKLVQRHMGLKAPSPPEG